jgi:hypothetical protein
MIIRAFTFLWPNVRVPIDSPHIQTEDWACCLELKYWSQSSLSIDVIGVVTGPSIACRNRLSPYSAHGSRTMPGLFIASCFRTHISRKPPFNSVLDCLESMANSFLDQMGCRWLLFQRVLAVRDYLIIYFYYSVWLDGPTVLYLDLCWCSQPVDVT